MPVLVYSLILVQCLSRSHVVAATGFGMVVQMSDAVKSRSSDSDGIRMGADAER
jgi:hypothetical protein